MSMYNETASPLGASYTRRPSRIPATSGLGKASRRAAPVTKSYAVLTNSTEERETYWSFIRWEGNENVLRRLQDQLDEIVDRRIEDECYYVFKLDTDHRLSAAAVDAMLKLESNGHVCCAKFEGKMRPVELGFTDDDLLHPGAMSEKADAVIGSYERIQRLMD